MKGRGVPKTAKNLRLDFSKRRRSGLGGKNRPPDLSRRASWPELRMESGCGDEEARLRARACRHTYHESASRGRQDAGDVVLGKDVHGGASGRARRRGPLAETGSLGVLERDGAHRRLRQARSPHRRGRQGRRGRRGESPRWIRLALHRRSDDWGCRRGARQLCNK